MIGYASTDRWFDEELYAGLPGMDGLGGVDGLWAEGSAGGGGGAERAGRAERAVGAERAECAECADKARGAEGAESAGRADKAHGAAQAERAGGRGRSLRIVHVCKFFPPERGGMETYVRDLAQEQAAAGHQVTVLAHTASASRRERMPDGYTVSRSRVWMRAGEYVPVAPGLARELWRAVRGGNLDILHVHCPNPAALWCVLLAGHRKAGAGVAAGEAGTVGQDAAGSASRVPHSPVLPQLARLPERPQLVVHWHADVIFPQDKQPNVAALALWRCMERALLARADRIVATSRPYLESSEFLAPWRAKCVVAPLRLSDRRGVSEAAVRDVRHAAVDFLRGVGPARARMEASPVAQPNLQNAGLEPARAEMQPRFQVAAQECSRGAETDTSCKANPLTLEHQARECSQKPVGTTRAVLGVGRLAHYKGFEVLVRAVAATPSLRCCIIGEGEEGPKLRALVQELGVQDRVLLPGEVDDDVLAACYEACDVFCLPSLLRTEAFGVVLLEALRAGKWCVVSNVPGSGMATVIQHGVNGWLVPPGDVRELGRRLESVRDESFLCKSSSNLANFIS